MTDLIPLSEMLPSANSWNLLRQQAQGFIQSGFLPSAIKTPEQAIVIMLKGRELGIPPMQALAHIHVISGKPAMSAELMLAQIFKLHPRAKISFPERTTKICVCKAAREGSDPTTFSFSIDDAKAAGLLSNPSWNKYPRAMLHARVVSEMARSLFPDAIAGVSYTPEELGADVNESGDIISVESVTVEPEKADQAAVQKMVTAFNGVGWNAKQISDALKKPLNLLTAQDLERARPIYEAARSEYYARDSSQDEPSEVAVAAETFWQAWLDAEARGVPWKSTGVTVSPEEFRSQGKVNDLYAVADLLKE